MAFINGILRSPSFPPLDPWLSGFAISYYYFGYVMSAMLIRLSGVSAAIGYNLVSGSWFALTAAAVLGWGRLDRGLEIEGQTRIKSEAG